MSRDSNGNYTLPGAYNPVVAGTVITDLWANTTLDDVKVALTDSLSRSGKGGMTAPFRLTDGTVTAPAFSFNTETTTGFYRAAAGDIRITVQGVDAAQFTASNIRFKIAGADSLTLSATANTSVAPLFAPTAPLGVSTTQVATMEALQNAVNALPAGALPDLAGNAGKFLTNNGITVSWGTVDIVGTGGTTITGNVTLTASSPAAMSVTPATPGLYVTLPDATTVSRSVAPFSVYNAGDFDYGVKNSAGTQLGWIRARTGAVIGLADNSTAAGVWTYYGLEKTGVTASIVNTTVSLSGSGSALRRITIDANRTCFLFGTDSCYAIIYDSSAQVWGSPTLVSTFTTSGGFLGVLSAANQVLCVHRGAVNTSIYTVTLTISGTSITVNTPVATALGALLQSVNQLIAVGTSWVVGYTRDTTTSAIRAITVSGTVPTIGSESTLSTTYLGGGTLTLYASGSIVRALVLTTATTLTVAPFTVSGTTLTAGTAANTATTAASIRSFLNGNGNIVCNYINTSHRAAIFRLSGTVEAVSTAVLSASTVPTDIQNNSDYVVVNANKTAFISNAGTTAWAVNVLTDTAGTASVGTEVTGNIIGNFSGVAGIVASGNLVRFAGQSSQVNVQFTLDCSGASPSLSSTQLINQDSASVSTGVLTPSNLYAVRSPRTLIAGSTAIVLSSSPAVVRILEFNAASITQSTPPYYFNNNSVQLSTTGAASNESYFGGTYQTVGPAGFVIQRVEAAA